MLPWMNASEMCYFLWVMVLPWSHGLVMCCFLWGMVLSWVHGSVECCDGLGKACCGTVFVSGVTSLVMLLLVSS